MKIDFLGDMKLMANKSNQKVIFLDIDGTLCDYNGTIPDSAKQAIWLARSNNHLVFLNTGRSKGEMDADLLNIGFDGMICGNGNFVEVNQKVILHQPLPETVEVEIVNWLKEHHSEFFLESNNGLFASEHFREKGLPVVRAYVQGKGQTNVSHMTVDTAFPAMQYGESIFRDDVNKISFILTDEVQPEIVKKQFPHLEFGTWGGRDEQPLFGDLRPKGITKSNAIKYLLQYLNLSLRDTIAFGDAQVDIPMFELCGIGVCMENGGPNAKKNADLVTDAVMDNGLYHAFEKLSLI
jgi:Cof subfamily protein (haloacid dehalogenase superfamily)